MKKIICLIIIFVLMSLVEIPANADVSYTNEKAVNSKLSSDKGSQSRHIHDPALGTETGRTTDGFDMVVYHKVAYYINHSAKAKGRICSIKMGSNGKIDIAKAKPIGSDSYCSNLNLLKGCLYYASNDGIQKYDITRNKLIYIYKGKGVYETIATKYGIIFTKLANDSRLHGIWSINTVGRNLKHLSTTGDIVNLQYYNKCIYYIYKQHTLGQLRSFNLETKKEQLVISGTGNIGEYHTNDIFDYHIYNNVVYISGWIKTKDNYTDRMVYSVDLVNTRNRNVLNFTGQPFMIGQKAYIYTLGSSDGFTSWVDIRTLDMKTVSIKRIFEDRGISSRLGFTYQTSFGKKMAYVFEYNNANLDALINIRNVDLKALE